MRKTKIVCTIGPSSEQPTVLKELILAGMDVARLNFAHGDFSEHQKRIYDVKSISNELKKPVAVLLDIKGPEIRLGKIEADNYLLATGDTLTLTTEEIIGDKFRISVSYKNLPSDVSVGTIILLDDGLIELEVKNVTGTEVVCVVKNNAKVKGRKSVNVPGIRVNLPGVTEKDKQHILFGIENGVDIIAASFVRSATDILEIKQILEDNNAGHINVIAKIENQEGIDNLREILSVADGIMVARGDLGVEVPSEDVPQIQKEMIRLCNVFGKPVITATHMLESMQTNPRPTRAEASDVANSVLDGTDAVMLSGETAAGLYPVESVKTMAKILEKTEGKLDYNNLIRSRFKESRITTTEVLSHSAALNSLILDAKAIITPTESGFTPRMVAKYRPYSPIVAVTNKDCVVKSLCLVWGVIPILGDKSFSVDELIECSINRASKLNLISKSDLVVITAGIPLGKSGSTNLLKIQVVD
ncbi:pyruvate kinase [Paenibacillus gansuensis]|uniref:Pyruvate kinase n=1 Tax=Paenibacillus gansuensis TaxID=306542 RepID=A0ABW5PI33_9BACL